MNRILFEPGEIADGIAVFGGARAEHVRSVLHGEVGQILKTGEVNGKIGTGEILELGETVRVRVRHDGEPLRPWVDLVLAPPRPRILKRLLPQLAALGVGQIVLVGAQKVEKDFWGATLLKEANYRPLLIDGLMQGCVSSLVPTVETRRNFRRFVTDELETRFPTANRLVAHPYEQGRGNGEQGRGGGSCWPLGRRAVGRTRKSRGWRLRAFRATRWGRASCVRTRRPLRFSRSSCCGTTVQIETQIQMKEHAHENQMAGLVVVDGRWRVRGRTAAL